MPSVPDEMLSDVNFSGKRSFLSVHIGSIQENQVCIDIEIQPTSDRGLLMFSQKLGSKGFMSLSLQGRVLELRILPGNHSTIIILCNYM